MKERACDRQCKTRSIGSSKYKNLKLKKKEGKPEALKYRKQLLFPSFMVTILEGNNGNVVEVHGS